MLFRVKCPYCKSIFNSADFLLEHCEYVHKVVYSNIEDAFIDWNNMEILEIYEKD